MTLRLRLVIALVALVAAGLAVFGYATYQAFARSEYRRIDAELASSTSLIARELADRAGLPGDRRQGPMRGQHHGPGGPGAPVVLPAGSYGELRDVDGAVLAAIQLGEFDLVPALPDTLPSGTSYHTVASVGDEQRWRVRAESAGADGLTVAVARPLADVEASLARLVLIESAAALVLLVVLATGAWLVLRHGLRPLERMAASARSITAGNLHQRVEVDDDRTEPGQLGVALNSMLDDLEVAFDEREATERRLRQFLADAAHELRTPLTSIQGFAELFRLGPDSEHVDLDVVMRRIEQESDRMRQLVEDLLLLARLDETRPPDHEPVDLTVVAADACSDAVATDPTRPIRLDAPEHAVVEGDAGYLRQAVGNLVTNAVRHTAPGTPVDVTVETSDGVVSTVVRDHGAGLDDEALVHAFDRFWQADPSRAGAGTGLGLSIVAAVAAEHGGSVTATNAPDGGACFRLTIPTATRRNADD